MPPETSWAGDWEPVLGEEKRTPLQIKRQIGKHGRNMATDLGTFYTVLYFLNNLHIFSLENPTYQLSFMVVEHVFCT